MTRKRKPFDPILKLEVVRMVALRRLITSRKGQFKWRPRQRIRTSCAARRGELLSRAMPRLPLL